MNLDNSQIRYVDVELAETNRVLEHAQRNLEMAFSRTPPGNMLYDRLDELLVDVKYIRQLIVKTRLNAEILGNTQPDPGRL